MKKKYIQIKSKIFPLPKIFYKNKSNLFVQKKIKKKIFKEKKIHKGTLLLKYKNYDIIDCDICKFIHILPIPRDTDNFYKKKYYSLTRKKNYFKFQQRDKEWWNEIFKERLNKFEKILGKKGDLLDIGCGPGFFLKYAKKHKWNVLGIEPSKKAYEFAKKKLNQNVINIDLENFYKTNSKKFDVIYSHGVLEHIKDPKNFISLASKILKKNGVLFLSVANDFNLLQLSMVSKVKKLWWLVPPEHINYFNLDSIKDFLVHNSFEIKNLTTSFPIDIFLLMGINYLDNKKIGRICQRYRVNFEKNLRKSKLSFLKDRLYNSLSLIGLGRQIEVIAKKK